MRRTAAGAGADGAGPIAAGAPHALDRRRGTGRALERTAGQRPDPADLLGRDAREVDRHPGPRREAEHEHLRLAHAVLALRTLRDRQDLRGLGPARLLLGGIEPVPAAVRVLATALGRVDDDEAAGLGHLVEPRTERELLGRLPAAVERDDDRTGRRRPRRNPDAIRATVERVAAERAGRRRGPERRRRQREGEQPGQRPGHRRRQGRRARRGSSTRPCLTSQTPRGDRRTNGRKSAARKKSVKSGS